MALASRLAEFRGTFDRAQVECAGVSWRYWRGGVAGEPVLWLTGALGVGELGFLNGLGLASRFRVLLPDYPPVSTLDAVARGLVSVLDAEGVEDAHVVGGSFGGMLAQHLAHGHPDRVRSLVLSHTTGPSPSFARAALMRVVTRLLPEGPYRALFRRRLRGSFLAADPFWVEYFDATMAGLTKADLASRVLLANEFLQAARAPAEPGARVDRVLILDSDDDPLLPRDQGGLARLYPAAETHTFSGMGHSAAIVRPEAYLAVVRRFLTGGRADGDAVGGAGRG